MLTLLSECHFWSFRDEIRIKDTDFGAFKYATKKDYDTKNQTSLGKKDYVEKRDGVIILKNRRPTRLKENLKKFEELLRTYKIIHSEWHDAYSIRILLSNGLLVYLCVNIYTGDLLKMAFDKYFIGKLASEVITDAIFTRQHILLAHNTNQITLVYLQKPNMRKIGPEKISNMDPKVFHILIPGPSERKLARHVIVNDSYDLIIVWTKSSQSEIYPWRPTIRDQDRANIHVYKLRTSKLESIAYCWTENDPIAVEFLRASDGCIITLEQKVSRKGEITAEICSYEIGQGKMKRLYLTSISIGTQLCCYSFSPDQEKLILGTIDRSICVHDLPRRQTKFTSKADIIPRHCAWHPDSGLIMIANDRSQFQCFDSALSFVANQLISEDVTPSNLLDLSHYFTIQPNLLNISFSCKPYMNLFSSLPSENAQTDCFLFLNFENGPIGCLRFFAGTGIIGDVHNSGLTHDVIIGKYLSLNQFEKAVNVLMSLNWETYGAMCLISLHQIANYVFRKNDIKKSRNELLNKALQSFTDDLNDETKDEFGDQVVDLKRRFFFFLLRHHLFTEAFDIAKNIGDYDLFMDIYNVTKISPAFISLSHESYMQAESILNQSESSAISPNDDTCDNIKFTGDTNSFSSCSQHSTCSECVALTKSRNSQNFNNKATCQKHQSNQTSTNGSNFIGTKARNCVPPLPYFKSSFFNDENLKINIPKPELRHNPVDGNGSVGFRLHSAFKPPASLANKHDANHYTNQNLLASSRLFRNFRNSQSEPLSPPIDRNNSSFQLTGLAPGPKSSRSWSQVPDQTLGIPIAMPSVKLLPRATTSPPQNYNYALPYGHNTIQKQPVFNSNESGNIHNIPLKYFQHPLVSGTIPSKKLISSNNITTGNDVFKPIKKPAASILSNSTSNYSSNYATTNLIGVSGGVHSKKDSGEKNKVKFSDTVQVAVVPEIPRKEKPLPPKRNGFRSLMTDPAKELADSLPLCHPNDDYLKDFNPISEPNTCNETEKNISEGESNSKSSSTIKVVHFGVV